ncbi:putative CHL4 family chromosome segregation protein [Talaromyces proteolyticus]|uniref:CHL4 family chromosome segregation protein n=1 Tax=Talaromyces proteolyticus TaxID=1131652 RepID=A0AAD4KQU9_9EURO|nr:putative CHL4 family chromosome segregation protein [Talaromyces proteolyticus]KAH8697286.1 putative CHL4 family chromosome segregation protein [Talaromyces proteolyticus]
MAKSKRIRAPTTSSLPNDLRIPSSTASLVKTIGKLSRQSLLDLVSLWLSKQNLTRYPPFLHRDSSANDDDQENSPYPAAHSIEDVRNAYEELQGRKGGKREVIDRVLEGDWRHGITLGQLAMVDIRYLEDHPTAQKWTAFRLVSADKKPNTDPKSTDLSPCLPRLHAVTFLSNLQREISPLVKAHYHLARSKAYPLTLLRVFITDSPYQYPRQNPAAYLDSSRIVYIAFPDSSPFIYTSMSATTGIASAATIGTDSRALRSIVRNAIARALSQQHERYNLEPTSLTAKSLDALLTLRGAGRTNMANGAFSIFADAVVEGTPIDPRPPATVSAEEYSQGDALAEKGDIASLSEIDTEESKRRSHGEDSPATKKRKFVVSTRFGTSGSISSPAALDRLDVRLLDYHDDDDDDNAQDGSERVKAYMENGEYAMGLSFTGINVVSGLRKLAEIGIIDPTRMPSWMTGEEGVSSMVARRGKRVRSDREQRTAR